MAHGECSEVRAHVLLLVLTACAFAVTIPSFTDENVEKTQLNNIVDAAAESKVNVLVFSVLEDFRTASVSAILLAAAVLRAALFREARFRSQCSATRASRSSAR